MRVFVFATIRSAVLGLVTSSMLALPATGANVAPEDMKAPS